MEGKRNTPLPTQSDTKQNKKVIDDPHFNYIHSTATRNEMSLAVGSAKWDNVHYNHLT